MGSLPPQQESNQIAERIADERSTRW